MIVRTPRLQTGEHLVDVPETGAQSVQGSLVVGRLQSCVAFIALAANVCDVLRQVVGTASCERDQLLFRLLDRLRCGEGVVMGNGRDCFSHRR